MDKEKTKQKYEEHYICLGGCRGVSKTPISCKTPDCVNIDHEFVKCYCTDGLHNNFRPIL